MTALASAVAIAVRTFLLKQNPTVLYNTPNERLVLDIEEGLKTVLKMIFDQGCV